MNFPNPHQAIDAENRERDQRVAKALRLEPKLVRVATENLHRWLAAELGQPHAALLEWQSVLQFLTPAEVADFLESRTPMAERLRQSSPFVGVLEAAAAHAGAA